MDIDGFTTSFTTVNNVNQGQVVSLALQGVSNKPGSFNKTASPTKRASATCCRNPFASA